MEKYRFFVLLVTLTVLLFATPLVREISPLAAPQVSRALIAGCFVAMLLSAVFAVARTRLTTRIAISLAVPLTLLQVLQVAVRNTAVDLPGYALGVAFLGYVIVVIVRFLFATQRVTSNTICAAVCTYLLLGILWALVFSTVDIVQAGSFTAPLKENSHVIRFGGERSVDALYLSFMTLTTLGFGDITPASPSAKMLVIMEAVVGQLFLAVLVARLVGLHISHSTMPQDPGDES